MITHEFRGDSREARFELTPKEVKEGALTMLMHSFNLLATSLESGKDILEAIGRYRQAKQIAIEQKVPRGEIAFTDSYYHSALLAHDGFVITGVGR